MKAARLLLLGLACLCLGTSLSASAASKGDVQVTYAYKGDLYSAIVKVNYQGGQKLRREIRLKPQNQPGGKLFIASPEILRRDLGLRWVINDETRSYVELSLRPEDEQPFLPKLKGFSKYRPVKPKKEEMCGYTCKVYASPKSDYTIWVPENSDWVLRAVKDPETIYEATEVSPGPQDDSLFEPPSDYRKLTYADLMNREVTPSMIADALFGEAESVCITDGNTSQKLNKTQVQELNHYVSGSKILEEEFSSITTNSCWFIIRLRTGREIELIFDYPAGLLSIDKSDVNRKCWYAYGLHPDLDPKFYIFDYRLSVPEDMREWINRLLPERIDF